MRAGLDRAHVAALAAAAICCAGTLPYFPRLMNANERPRLLQGRALVEDGVWHLEAPSVAGIPAGIDVARDRHGHLVSNKPPGASVVAAAAWWGLRRVAERPTVRAHTQASRVLGGLLPSGLAIGVLVAHGTRRLGAAVAVAAVVIFALATPWLAYSKLLFGHVLAGALVLAALFFALRSRDRGERAGAYALAAGLHGGAALAVDSMAAFAAPGLLVALLSGAGVARSAAVSRLAAAGLGAALPLGLLVAYQAHVFGSAWATGYHHVVDPGFARIHGAGWLGFGAPTAASFAEHLASPWGGILYFVPVAAPAVVGLVRDTKATDPTARACLVLVVTALIAVLCLRQTGGWRVGPRYFVFALPGLVPGLWAVLRDGRPGELRLLAATATWGAVVGGLAAHLFPHLVPVGHPLADVLVPLAVRGGPAPWLVGLAVITTAGALLRCTSSSRASRRAIVQGVLLGIGLAVVASLWSTASGRAELPAIAGLFAEDRA